MRPRATTRPSHDRGPDDIDLIRVRAALSIGLSPAEALGTATDPTSRDLVNALQFGATLDRLARRRDLPESSAWLIRALAVAERAGDGAVAALDIALRARSDQRIDAQRLQARTAQAAGTAKVLTILPLAALALLIALDPSALGFYRTPIGWACVGVTGVLAFAGQRWSRRLITRAAEAAARADPLATPRGGFDRARAAAVAVPVAVAMLVVAPPVVALAVGAVSAGFAGAARGVPPPPAMPFTEVVHLLRMALCARAGPIAAFELVATVTAPPLSDRLTAVAARLRNGGDIERALSDVGLDAVGAVLAVTERWGADAAEPLGLVSDMVRARQRGAAETAAEHVQLALVFPTTLFTLPAFVLSVVPPLLWTALR